MNRLRHLYLAIMGDTPPQPRFSPTVSPDATAIEELRDALRPFARMHRANDRPDTAVSCRGVGINMTCISTEDYARAFYLLDEHNI